jgi:hypothetical protein
MNFNFQEWLLILEELKPKSLAFKILGNTVDNAGKPVLSTDPNIIKTTQEFNKIFSASIPEAQQKNIYPTAAYVYKTNLSVGEGEFSRDLKDYYKFVIGNQLPILSFDDNGVVTGNYIIGKPKDTGNPYSNYIDWASAVHSKNSENEDEETKKLHQSLQKSTGDVSDQEQVAKSPDEKIKVYKANAVDKCIILGRGQRFCISQPGNSQFHGYRNTKDSTFYFVYDNTRNDDLKVVVVDATRNGIEITDGQNNTAKTMQDPYETTPKRITSNPDLYFKYLKEKGVDTTIFKNEPKTPKEDAEHAKLGKSVQDLAWFRSLTYEERKNYISRGHPLSDEQFNFLFTTRSEPLLKIYVSTGVILHGKQSNLVLNNPYFKDLKLNYLNARMHNFPNTKLNVEEYISMPPKQKQELTEKYGDEIKDYISRNNMQIEDYLNLPEDKKTEIKTLFKDNVINLIANNSMQIEDYLSLPEDKKTEIKTLFKNDVSNLMLHNSIKLEDYLNFPEDKKTEIKTLFKGDGSIFISPNNSNYDRYNYIKLDDYINLPEDKKAEFKTLFKGYFKDVISTSYSFFRKYEENPSLEFTDEIKNLITCNNSNFISEIIRQPNENNVKFLTDTLRSSEPCKGLIDDILNSHDSIRDTFTPFYNDKVKVIDLLHLLSNYSNQMPIKNMSNLIEKMRSYLGSSSKYIFMFRRFFQNFASELPDAFYIDRDQEGTHHSNISKDHENSTIYLFTNILKWSFENKIDNDAISTIKFIVDAIGNKKIPRTTRDLIKDKVGEEGYKSIFPEQQQKQPSPEQIDKAYRGDSTREARDYKF